MVVVRRRIATLEEGEEIRVGDVAMEIIELLPAEAAMVK